jgi:hypothetical protein
MDRKMLVVLAKGLATWTPIYRLRTGRTGGSCSARYCYSVWLRHLHFACKHGFTAVPAAVAELGPGDSLGSGLSAMLCGADEYYALDVVRFADPERNVAILDELAELFRRREPIPGPGEFPRVMPLLRDYGFPSTILTADLFDRTLHPERLENIRRALRDGKGKSFGGVRITYSVPWHDPTVIRPESVGLAFSQAVMQYVYELEHTYDALWQWLKPGAVMSHEIDFSCHDMASTWDGHWAYSDRLWRIAKGRRPVTLSRQPCSAHVEMVRRRGFEVLHEDRTRQAAALPRPRLARRFRTMSDDDRSTRAAFILSSRRSPAEGTATP